MNWKPTVVLAVLAAATFGAWLVLQPEEEASVIREKPFDVWRESVFQRITIRVPEQPEMVLRRNAQAVAGSVWHLETPIQAPADDSRIAEMIAALRRLSRDRSIKQGDAEYTPGTYGLDKPVVTVQVEAGDEKRIVKFGNPSSRLPNTRFYMIEGDPEIYFGPSDSVGPFQKTTGDLRSRVFVWFDPARVVGVESSRKFLRAGADGKPGLKPEYETLKFKTKEGPGGAPRWYLVGVNDEVRDDPADGIGHLIMGVRDQKAEEFVPIPDPAALGFEEPEFVAKFDVLQPPSTATKSLKVAFGKIEEKANRKVMYVRVDDANEAAVISAGAFERIRKERKMFIPLQLLDVEAELVSTLELASHTGHRVVLEKQESETPRGNERWKSLSWLVKEPAGLAGRVDPAEVSDYVKSLFTATFEDILGEQPDLASFGLDKPKLTLTVRGKTKSGEPIVRTYTMGRPGDSKTGFILKSTGKDIFKLSEETSRRIERADLNFRKLDLFNTTVDAVVEVSFLFRKDHLSANDVQFTVRKGEGGKWQLAGGDPQAKVDPDRMTAILGAINYIKAESYITRDPGVAEELGLSGTNPQGRLVIRYADPANPGKSAEKVLRFSKPHGDPSGRSRLYYAKFEPAPGDDSPSSDATIIFRIKTEVVEALRAGVVVQNKPLPE